MSDLHGNTADIVMQAGQRQVWDETARAFSDAAAIAAPAGEIISKRLIALAHVASGQRVLDVATGAGDPALAAAQVVGPTGEVVGIDHAPQMLEAARMRAAAAGLTNVTFVEGAAQALDLPRESFDAVLSRWGLMFFVPLVPALEGFRRVLRPGGYLAAAVWGAPQEVPIISASCAAVFEQLGRPLPPPDAPGPFNLANADKLAQSLTDAGFHDARTESLTMSVTFSSAEVFARFQRATNQMVVGLIAQQPAERQAALWETVAQAGARMASPDGSITLHNRCICVSGRA
ncbi:MAG TPA: methyltransferase domain-containing protein [Ktedonobacterales bacterium]|nr:methyltransferase domain-containing protein [Ktedonobacterales bacterium]